MSNATGATSVHRTTARGRGRAIRELSVPTLLRVLAVLLVAALPLYLSSSLLQTGLFCMAAIIGAIGLNLLSGNAGQLSLAHAFFLAVGAYGYAFFAGQPSHIEGAAGSGLGLPSPLAAVLAVLLASLIGLLFSPVASRLRGIYLAIASLALVFIGQQILLTLTNVTGGFNGRDVPSMRLFGFTFDATDPTLDVLGVPFGKYERLWYLGLILSVLGYVFAKNLLRGRPGSALTMVRDSEVAAAVMGVDVRRYKTAAFILSSLYAGLAGVLFGLTFARIVPDTFGFDLSVQFVAMIVIGGLTSVGGATLGAIFVVALPQMLSQYSSNIPFLAAPGSGGIDAGSFARYVYGAAIIGFLLFEPGGLAAIGGRISDWVRRRQRLHDPFLHVDDVPEASPAKAVAPAPVTASNTDSPAPVTRRLRP